MCDSEGAAVCSCDDGKAQAGAEKRMLILRKALFTQGFQIAISPFVYLISTALGRMHSWST